MFTIDPTMFLDKIEMQEEKSKSQAEISIRNLPVLHAELKTVWLKIPETWAAGMVMTGVRM